MNFIVEDNYLNVEGDWPETDREAIQASIAKWRAIADWHTEHPEQDALVQNFKSYSCALCHLYLIDGPSEECYQCPVMIATGWEQCKGTPFMDYYDDPCADNALAEMAFLTELLEDYSED